MVATSDVQTNGSNGYTDNTHVAGWIQKTVAGEEDIGKIERSQPSGY